MYMYMYIYVYIYNRRYWPGQSGGKIFAQNAPTIYRYMYIRVHVNISTAEYNENNSPCDALFADYFIP